MTEQMEREVAAIFAELSRNAPPHESLITDVRRRTKRIRRSRQIKSTAIALALLPAIGVSVWAISGARTGTADPTAAPSVSTQQTGSLPGTSSASCAFEPTAANVARRTTFAFDGTVASIAQLAGGQLARVTFIVNEWFFGASGKPTTIDMPAPQTGRPVVSMGESTPDSYQVGTRLLVSGQQASGSASMDGASAWGCGFTRYYDRETANSWRAAAQASSLS